MLENFFRQLTTDPDSISFSQSIDLIESLYDFTETAFRNGDKQNAAGENNGSCKIFAFALLHRLSEPQTLQMFGDYYRKDVSGKPNRFRSRLISGSLCSMAGMALNLPVRR